MQNNIPEIPIEIPPPAVKPPWDDSPGLRWQLGEVAGQTRLIADSSYLDDGVPLPYVLELIDDGCWRASFEGSHVHTGTLAECEAACKRVAEDERIKGGE